LTTEPRRLPSAAIKFNRYVVEKHGKHAGVRDIAMIEHTIACPSNIRSVPGSVK